MSPAENPKYTPEAMLLRRGQSPSIADLSALRVPRHGRQRAFVASGARPGSRIAHPGQQTRSGGLPEVR